MLPLASITLLALTGQAVAWGGLGHRTVGYLAQHLFSEDASQLIRDLLKPTDTFDISDAAVWPDTIRMRQPFTEGWHFIDAKDNPPESCNLDFERDCKPIQGCVISALSNQTSLLLNTTNPFRTRNEALKFILHFIGDIHQPLHTEDLARGGNDIPVQFDGHRTQRTNLHSVWDSSIARKLNGLSFDAHAVEEKPAAVKWAAQLAERVKLSSSASSSEGLGLGLSLADECTDLEDLNRCGIEWATESNALVCKYVLAPGLSWVKENDLGRGEYYEGAAPVVELQIARAGVRLAAWVNAVAAAIADEAAGGEMGVGKDDL